MAKGKPFASNTHRVISGFHTRKRKRKEKKKNPTEGVDSLETHNQVKAGGGADPTSLYNLSAGLIASS